MLDEECLRPGEVSDTTFLHKLNQVCCKHAHYESRGCRKTQSDRTLPHDAFRLVHYAGSVRVFSFSVSLSHSHSACLFILFVSFCLFINWFKALTVAAKSENLNLRHELTLARGQGCVIQFPLLFKSDWILYIRFCKVKNPVFTNK